MEYGQLRDALNEIVHDGEYAFYVRQWIDYREVKQWRMKMLHDIELDDGSVLECMYPNGRGWFGGHGGGSGRVDDANVKRIRISVRQLGDALNPVSRQSGLSPVSRFATGW